MGSQSRRPGKDRGQFKVDHAESPVGLPVGHVAHFRIIVTDAVQLKLGKKFADSLLIKMLDAAAAVGRDNAQFGNIRDQ